MNRYVWIGVAIVLALVAWYLLRPNARVTNYPSSGTDIIAFGDSLVSGAGATNGNDFVSLLEKQIGRRSLILVFPAIPLRTDLRASDRLMFIIQKSLFYFSVAMTI
jgi:hypothetical protein